MQSAAEIEQHHHRPIAWCSPCGRSYSRRKFETLSHLGTEARSGKRYQRAACACGEVVKARIEDAGRTELERMASDASLNRQAFERGPSTGDVRFVVVCGVVAAAFAFTAWVLS
jgi:hypothetical protein